MGTSYGFTTEKTKFEGKKYLYSYSEIIFCLYKIKFRARGPIIEMDGPEDGRKNKEAQHHIFLGRQPWSR
jgi:hypothetical protein